MLQVSTGMSLALTVALLVTGCTDEGGTTASTSTAPPGLPSGIELARVGTIGDYPPDDRCVVVNMDADGRIEMEGAEISFKQLKAMLLFHAGKARGEEETRSSLVHVVLRIDRSIPWRVVAWLMMACADPVVRMDKVCFAVLPEVGDEEGTLAAHLPRDRGLSGPGMRPELPRRSRVRLRRTGGGFSPAELYASFRNRPGAEGASVFLEPEPLVPIGVVLQAVDALHRAGAAKVDFRGQPPSRTGRKIREVVADARRQKLDPEVHVDGKPVIVIGGTPEMPPAERVRGGYAGTFGRVDELYEEIIEFDADVQSRIDEPPPGMLEEEIKPDIIEQKPIEPDDTIIEDPVIKDAVVDEFKPTNAVDHALVWLRDRQQADGRWKCDGTAAESAHYDPGVTGLAVLAFLNAGESHKHGVFKRTVKQALQYLKSIQDPEGCFGPRKTQRYIYNHAIATLAMAHAFALTNSPLFKQSAQLGVDFIAKCRNPDLAWRYGVRPGDNDTSVSGWVFMALHVAKQAGLRVDDGCFTGMRAWLEKVTHPENGRVGYATRGEGPGENPEIELDLPESLTAIGIMARVFLGDDPATSNSIRKGAALVRADPPLWGKEGRLANMCSWYWGSLAMYSVGGEGWRTWNRALKDVVMANQRTEGEFKGTWDPVGRWGKEGGRTYATALGVICLEVYYRYFKIAGLQK